MAEDTRSDLRKNYEEQLEYLCLLALNGELSRRELKNSLLDLAKREHANAYTTNGGSVDTPEWEAIRADVEKQHAKSAEKLSRQIFDGTFTIE